jgi:hypothetical protein
MKGLTAPVGGQQNYWTSKHGWVRGSWFTVYGLGFMVYGLWFTVHGLGFTVHGLGFTVHGGAPRSRLAPATFTLTPTLQLTSLTLDASRRIQTDPPITFNPVAFGRTPVHCILNLFNLI